MRVSALAKEIGIASKELVSKCKELGLGVTHHANNLTDDQAGFVRNSFKPAQRRVIDLEKLKPKPSSRPSRRDGAGRGGSGPAGGRGGRTGGPQGSRPPARGGNRPGSAPTSAPMPSADSKDRRSKGGKKGPGTNPKTNNNFFSGGKAPSGGERFLRKSNRGGSAGGRRGGRDRSFGKRGGTPDSAPKPVVEITGPVDIQTPISVREFSQLAGIKINEILAHLMKQGIMININQYLGAEEALEIGGHFGREVNILEEVDALEALEKEIEAGSEEIIERPPIVTILGHVDHGKTSLLDRIRNANVQEKEAGGITQHISSYKISHNGKDVSFVDTPGHAAFTAMRARGANVTDIILLIIAADDGVMPQTIESINHARASEAPIIVVINKIDVPNANIDRVKQQLSGHDLLIEEWGGETICAEVSAKTGEGIDKLLEFILLQSEVMELRGAPSRPGVGRVLESELSEGLGVLTRLIVTDGSVKRGDFILCGTTFGRVKDVYCSLGKKQGKAGPSSPVAVTGLETVPQAGEKFVVVDSIQKARELSLLALEKTKREDQFQKQQHVSLETLAKHVANKGRSELRVVIKGDVIGSLEVIEKSLLDIEHDEIGVRVVHKAVGGINESDVVLADASDAIILGFHVTANIRARELARQKSVEIRSYQIVYELLDEVRASLSGMLKPEKVEKIIGHAEVRDVIKVPKVGNIAGCYVIDGAVRRNAEVRVTRDDIIIYTGKLASLNRFKDSVKEVKLHLECGMLIDGYDDVKTGDILEFIEYDLIARTLDS